MIIIIIILRRRRRRRTLLTLQNGSVSTVIKAGLNLCVAILKYSITSISMNKISTTKKKKTNCKTKLVSKEAI